MGKLEKPSPIVDINVPKRAKSWLARLGRFCKLLYLQWNADRCALRAAALAFVTVLSLVPLTAVGIALLDATGHSMGEDALVNYISQHVMPLEGEHIVGYIRDFAENIKVRALGAVGVILTLGLSYLLFDSVEQAFNDIWRARQRRPLLRKFTVFWALATLGPFVLALSLLQGAALLRGMTPVWILLPFMGTWLLLVLANRLLPHTRVTWRSAILAGFVSALVFEIAKYGFSIYFTKVAFTNYSTIYGRLALIPTLLVWIGASWTAVLIGVETGYVLQHQSLVEMRHRENMFSDPETGWTRWVNGSVAARIMLAIAVWYATGRGAISARALSEAFNLPEEAVAEILRRFRETGMLVEVQGDVEGCMPGRPLSAITLNEILNVFEDSDIEQSEGEALDETFEKLRETQEETLDGLDFSVLAERQLEHEKPNSHSKKERKAAQNMQKPARKKSTAQKNE
jgi:membrane protein